MRGEEMPVMIPPAAILGDCARDGIVEIPLALLPGASDLH
jgi:hypothetical protein